MQNEWEQIVRCLFVNLALLTFISPFTAVAQQAPKMILEGFAVDYPPKALVEGREGTVHYRLAIKTNGRVKSCTVTKSSGHVDLDEAACTTMKKKVRFTPALNERGKAVAGIFSSQFKFKIPR